MRIFWLALAVALCISATEPQAARAVYIGGTVEDLRVGEKSELYTTHRQEFYVAVKSRSLGIPYEHINLVEYGQSVSRRYAEAILISPLFLAAKSHKHFLTVGYTDENGRQQAVVFRVDKRDIRVVLVALEARTGLKVTFQDEEARKAGKG
jgi:hypothetical protein